MFPKSYLYLIYGKRVKSINRLIRRFNACKDYRYLKFQLLYDPLQHKFHNKEDALGGNLEDKGDLLSKIVIITTRNGTLKISTKDTPWKGQFASESLSVLREEWFSSHIFPTGVLILD